MIPEPSDSVVPAANTDRGLSVERKGSGALRRLPDWIAEEWDAEARDEDFREEVRDLAYDHNTGLYDPFHDDEPEDEEFREFSE